VQVQTVEPLLRNGTHFIDIILYLTGLQAAEIRGGFLTEQYRDSGGGAARFDDAGGGGTVLTEEGIPVMLDASLPSAVAAQNWLYVGTEGVLLLEREAFSEAHYWSNDDGEFSKQQQVSRRPLFVPEP